MPSAVTSSMKLLIAKGAQKRVVLTEAGKDVADFILGLVAMPLGAVDRLVPYGGSLGSSIANLYASAEKMDDAYMQSTAARGALLVAPEPNHALPLYLHRCDACQQASPLPQGISRGFVKDTAKYTVMDDLTVTPISDNVSIVALLKSLGYKDLDALEETTVLVGRQEAMDILKAALQSKTVLTDVFLRTYPGTAKQDPSSSLGAPHPYYY